MTIAPALIPVLAQAAPAGGGGWVGTLLLFGGMAAIMYFLFIRPQQKEKKAREELLSSLSKGDEVVTNGGLHGRVASVDGELVKVELGPKTVVTVEKTAITRKVGDEPTDDSKK
ncbi:MAG: preprotein translocase subunit YajC [Myxococcota bacterium]